eukprot:TRINITY_DN8971_c0_g2_i1.p2 TRINITY_DN8971_c0_g2~~TRINITY_DN8971_c0_g2_i1.p2  ORF type:complete len:162 (+),score=30.79 TRINITY_DN8971_c0_g2_i1:161-646(+)
MCIRDRGINAEYMGILINPNFSNNFKQDFWKTNNFIKHPLQISYIGVSGDKPYYLCENNQEIDLFIPIPFADPESKIWRRFQVSKNFEIDYQQFEFKYKQKEQNINQEIYYIIDICPLTQNLKEFKAIKKNNKEVKRYFKEMKSENSKLAAYKHYKFVKAE